MQNNIPWVKVREDDGIGESIGFDIIPVDWRAIETIDLGILNSYVNPLKPYRFTNITLPKETTHVKLTILNVYPGTKYRETCIRAFDIYFNLWDK